YEFQGGELDNLKQEVRKLLKTTPQEYPSVMLKLIDSMQRLGVAYHFEEEIKDALNLAQFDYFTANLYPTSLQFRLRRDHGCTIGSDNEVMFSQFVRWWMDLGLKEKLSFSRDRLMENYLWAMGMVSESHFSNCRNGLTKFVCILSAIDDMYDIYGSIDELERFTDAVNRWDVRATDDLPEYMKICYLAMFNFGNEIAYNVLRDHGLNVVSYIKEEWANLCGAYLVEARWFYSGFIPTLEEYLKNAWKSVGGPAAIAHAYLLLGSPITKTSLDSFKASSELIYWSSIITRLSDDLGTSKVISTHEHSKLFLSFKRVAIEHSSNSTFRINFLTILVLSSSKLCALKDEIMRGDVAKSIQCYMNERSVTEEQARDHIKGIVRESWRKLNETIAQNSHPTPMISMSLNMARTAQCIYQHGDGIGTSLGVTKYRLTSLIVDPIPIERLTHGEVRGRTHSYAVENAYSISK
ncbi:hypothetical protein C3L33_10322, partial [Rhododendron williamsianum]